MHLHALPTPTRNVNPTLLTPSAGFFTPHRGKHYPRCILNSSFKYGFCSVFERVSEPLTGLGNHGCLMGIRCEGLKEKDDGFYMRRCVELARKAIGCTSPNPMVGCVIVKNGEIVGEGFHPRAGQPHAEVFALRDAGELAEKSTAYVSLEPCNHFGRTPPCTEALIKAKVKKVVVGMVDPNPIVASKGVNRLRESGIDVTVGVEEDLCKKLIEAFSHRMLTGKPFVTMRYSVSINGHILNELGKGVSERGGYYSQLLQEYDAVILPSTLLTEKSFPLSQEPGANQPVHIILATNLNSPAQLPVFTSEVDAKQVIVFTDNDKVLQSNKAQQGIETVVLDKINLNAVLDYCTHLGFCSILLDLKGHSVDSVEVIKEGLDQGFLQKVVMEILPLWDGSGENSILASKSLERRLNLKNLQSRISGESIIVEGYFSQS